MNTTFENAAIAAETLLSPFIRFNNPQFDPEGIAARRRLLTRASKLLDMMLRWRKYTGEKLGLGQLCVRFVNNYVLPISRSGWEVGGEEKARQVIPRIGRHNEPHTNAFLSDDSRVAPGFSSLSEPLTTMTAPLYSVSCRLYHYSEVTLSACFHFNHQRTDSELAATSCAR